MKLSGEMVSLRDVTYNCNEGTTVFPRLQEGSSFDAEELGQKLIPNPLLKGSINSSEEKLNLYQHTWRFFHSHLALANLGLHPTALNLH